eukprot:tig00021571_g22369.t1
MEKRAREEDASSGSADAKRGREGPDGGGEASSAAPGLGASEAAGSEPAPVSGVAEPVSVASESAGPVALDAPAAAPGMPISAPVPAATGPVSLRDGSLRAAQALWADGTLRRYTVPGVVTPWGGRSPAGARGKYLAFYAVFVGRDPGIYFMWDERGANEAPGPTARDQVYQCRSAFKRFETIEAAMDAMERRPLERVDE